MSDRHRETIVAMGDDPDESEAERQYAAADLFMGIVPALCKLLGPRAVCAGLVSALLNHLARSAADDTARTVIASLSDAFEQTLAALRLSALRPDDASKAN